MGHQRPGPLAAVFAAVMTKARLTGPWAARLRASGGKRTQRDPRDLMLASGDCRSRT